MSRIVVFLHLYITCANWNYLYNWKSVSRIKIHRIRNSDLKSHVIIYLQTYVNTIRCRALYNTKPESFLVPLQKSIITNMNRELYSRYVVCYSWCNVIYVYCEWGIIIGLGLCEICKLKNVIKCLRARL